jgi:acyl-CoA thioesterase I
MQSLLLFHLVSGHAWFTAGAVVLILIGLELGGIFRRRPGLQRFARLLFLLAVGVAMLSGTPVPLWLAIPLTAAILAVIAMRFRDEPARSSRFASIAALVLVVAALAFEAPWHRAPSLDKAPRSVMVLGDSLSSGGFAETRAWPEQLETRAGIPTTSFANAGETVGSALVYQIDRLTEAGPDTLIVIELGGNDLLGGTPARGFATDLDAVLTAARSSGSDVVMFELPIPPGRWHWGAIQRKAARRHDVPLIPKRVLARLISNGELVEDGLHPTDAGHQYLAREVARLLP